MGTVVWLRCITTLDIPPAQVLESALADEVEEVILVARNKDGSLRVASSKADAAHVLWGLEQAKMFLLNAATTPDYIRDRENGVDPAP